MEQMVAEVLLVVEHAISTRHILENRDTFTPLFWFPERKRGTIDSQLFLFAIIQVETWCCICGGWTQLHYSWD